MVLGAKIRKEEISKNLSFHLRKPEKRSKKEK
jgi:hypothetical protein